MTSVAAPRPWEARQSDDRRVAHQNSDAPAPPRGGRSAPHDGLASRSERRHSGLEERQGHVHHLQRHPRPDSSDSCPAGRRGGPTPVVLTRIVQERGCPKPLAAARRAPAVTRMPEAHCQMIGRPDVSNSAIVLPPCYHRRTNPMSRPTSLGRAVWGTASKSLHTRCFLRSARVRYPWTFGNTPLRGNQRVSRCPRDRPLF